MALEDKPPPDPVEGEATSSHITLEALALLVRPHASFQLYASPLPSTLCPMNAN